MLTGGAVAAALVLGSVAGAAAEPIAAAPNAGGGSAARSHAAPVARSGPVGVGAVQQAKQSAKAKAKAKKAAKKLSAFVKKTHTQARKQAKNPKAFNDTFGAYKSSKKQLGYVSITGKGYQLSNPSKSAAKKYVKAVSSRLKKQGLKQVGSSRFYDLQSRTYSNKRYTCTVRQSRSSAAYGYAAFTCQTTKKIKAAQKKLAPFIAAYKKGGQNPNKVAFSDRTRVRSSLSKSYSSYKRAELSAVSPASGGQMGWYRSLYAKAPGKKWALTAATTSSAGPFECKTLERNSTHARAWVRESCYRGTYQNGYESTVRVN